MPGRGNDALWTGCTMLARPNQRLTALAAEAARCARALLPADSGLLLSLEVDATDTLRLVWWRRNFEQVAQISAAADGFCSPDSDEGALQDAAAELLDYLAGRWPTPPSDFGVITDGIGVAFAPNHPWPSAEGWLLKQASDASGLVAILPLDPNGPCALLAATDCGTVLH